ncbi:TIGR00180 family glycosyltransferase [Porticoccaceae bacterium]|nr:TIGR00180 family glycosyltransferase [Porticoccaceae bacterium]
MNDLTILLTLKGRKSFTKRWLDWMALENCPFPIVIADGDADKTFTKNLLKKDTYKNLNIDYREYPEDINTKTFILKFSDAVSIVKTKYIIFADNDDFVIINNLKKALNFMKNNEKIDSLALQHYRFKILNDSKDVDSKLYLNGFDIKFEILAPLKNNNFFKNSSITRLAESIKIFPSDYFYYAVHKTNNLRYSSQLTAQKKMENFFFWERFLTSSVAVVGNINCDKSFEPFVVRQDETSNSAIYLSETEKLIDLRYSPKWKIQLKNFIDGLYEVHKFNDGPSIYGFKTRVRIYFEINIIVRILRGKISRVLIKYKKIHSFLNSLLLFRLGKNRSNINKSYFEKNSEIKKLITFLNN